MDHIIWLSLGLTIGASFSSIFFMLYLFSEEEKEKLAKKISNNVTKALQKMEESKSE